MFHEYLHVWSSQNGTVRQGHIFHDYVEVPVVNAVTSRGRGIKGLYPDTFILFCLTHRANDCRQHHYNCKIRCVIWCSHICCFWLLEKKRIASGLWYRCTCAWVLNIRKSLKWLNITDGHQITKHMFTSFFVKHIP